MAALAVPASWVVRPLGRPVDLRAAVRGRENGASKGDEPVDLRAAVRGRENGASTGDEPVAFGAAVRSRENGASKGDALGAAVPVRRSARALHAACAELLPGYSAASREPWRQALLTAGCLDARPRDRARQLDAPPLIVEDVVQPSDVLCALWLARRSGLFHPGSPCGDGIGLRSACEIVPSYAPSLAEERRAEVLEALRANAAWRAHRAARSA